MEMTNKEYQREWARNRRISHPENVKRNEAVYRAKKPDKAAECSRNWRDKNKDKVIAYKKAYRSRRNELNKLRRETDRQFRTEENIRTRINGALYSAGFRSAFSCEELLGCSVAEFMLHLESLFDAGMNWDNRGVYRRGGPNVWHIDHIRPCASFDLSDPEQQKKCFHWSNQRPMWAVVNLSKSSRHEGVFIRKSTKYLTEQNS